MLPSVLGRIVLACFLLCTLPTYLGAQTIDQIGTDDTFDVASWNIEWFGSSSNGPTDDQRQFDNVLTILRDTDIDLWAVQEIADRFDFNALLDALGNGYAGTLATNSTTQRIGFIWKTDVVRLNGPAEHILENFPTPFASRPPLQIVASVTLEGRTEVITFITVHMKAFSDVSSYERRVEAAQRLKTYLDFGDLEREPVVVLGDFNDELLRSISGGRTSPYAPFLEDSDDYFFPSLVPEQQNDFTFIGGSRSTIDHIMITSELLPMYFQNSGDALDQLADAIPGFSSNTSDHLPIFTRFFFPETNTSRDDSYPLAFDYAISAPYPNPFENQLKLDLTLPRAQHIATSVFDIRGRQVGATNERFMSAGFQTLELALDDLATGLYLVRIQTEEGTVWRSAIRQ